MSSKFSRRMGRIVQQLHLITKGHIVNWPWKGRESRRKTRYDVTRDAAMRYLRRYSRIVSKATPAPVDMTPEPERAFTIWYQGEQQAPPLARACFRSMRRHLKQELVVLDEKTLFDWITLPDYIVRKWREGKIKHTQFSDICRVELLYTHGGVWLDATDYVTAPVPDYIMDQDVFMFMGGSKVRGYYAMIQSCFIRGRKGNPLLGIWREAIYEYWKNEDSKINYFVHHLLLRLAVTKNAQAESLFAKMTKVDQDPTHELWYDHVCDKYDQKEFRRLTEGSFFQKTNYKDPRLASIQPGTVADYVVNHK